MSSRWGEPAERIEPGPAGAWGERGRCPRCGSGRVAHLVYGVPTRDVIDSAPAWVWFPGSVADGPEDRDCGACGHAWVSDRSVRA
ncbi:MAG TPA: hypothetical protein VFH10_08365 [Nocardioides sp.]|uniref:hypothetical protein n=1 Tax=Nocardioides sp. TaxID=35761 RepID=UPI002D7EBBC0|nr:hypothetical protein [Nocardioides sp.]HET6652639.1 hypothetical protein [Nocardioides sp.]